MNDRRQRLAALLADDPQDVFLRYSLALEQQKFGEHEASLSGLRLLVVEDPPYVPAYLMLGQQLAALARFAEAREILRNGIDAARRANNSHAAGEMAELLVRLGECSE